LDRNWLALVLAPTSAYPAFALVAVALDPPSTLSAWPARLIDAFGGMLWSGWYLFPVPYVLFFGVEGLLLVRRRSLSSLSWSIVLPLGTALGALTMQLWAQVTGLGGNARTFTLGAGVGLLCAAVLVAVRAPRAAS
jgi:hypothetical protein